VDPRFAEAIRDKIIQVKDASGETEADHLNSQNEVGAELRELCGEYTSRRLLMKRAMIEPRFKDGTRASCLPLKLSMQPELNKPAIEHAVETLTQLCHLCAHRLGQVPPKNVTNMAIVGWLALQVDQPNGHGERPKWFAV